jgi:hypothetical protein
VFAAPGVRSQKNCRGSQHSQSFFERGRSPVRKKTGERECKLRDHVSKRDPGKRESDARERVRASEVKLQKSVGSSLDPEKRVSALRAKARGGTMCGDGGLANGNFGDAKAAHEESRVKGH